jgi:hypothetical protein
VPTFILFILAGFVGLMALILLVAGTLALAGKTAYEDWRAAQGLDGSRRRRPRYDDDDRRPRRRDGDDDRPRRRRHDDYDD